MRTLVVGSGAREAAIAKRLSENSALYAVMSHKNPSLINFSEQSDGAYLIGDTNDGGLITDFAAGNNIDIAFISADASLEAGVVDQLLQKNIKTVGPTRSGAEIEWNKAFGHKFLESVDADFSPKYWVLDNPTAINKLFDQLEQDNIFVAVKPQGLTGGKGVQVMGEHLETFEEARRYALKVLSLQIGKSSCVVIEEKLEGFEFTIQAITDGVTVICPPATYDYPYRYEGDTGPGTGGMGCITDNSLCLPFMTTKDFNRCSQLIQKVVTKLNHEGRHFNGILNAGFFIGPRGLKIYEFNARFGDPECMNILELLDSSLLDILINITHQSLSPNHILFKKQASVIKYLVSPEYAIRESKQHTYSLNLDAIESEGVDVFFASSIALPEHNWFQTVGNSRNVALATLDSSISKAAQKIDFCIQKYFDGPLEFRKDIGFNLNIS